MSNKTFGLLMAGLIFLVPAATIVAVEITKERYTPIYTLTDDRSASVINDNFRRATNILIEDANLNVSLNATSTFTVIQLNVAQPDDNYGIFLNFQSSATVKNKTSNSFKIEHAPAGAGATLDWILVR